MCVYIFHPSAAASLTLMLSSLCLASEIRGTSLIQACKEGLRPAGGQPGGAHPEIRGVSRRWRAVCSQYRSCLLCFKGSHFPHMLLSCFRLRGKRRHLGSPGGLHHHSLPVQQDPSAADDQARHDHAALPDHQVQCEQEHVFKEKWANTSMIDTRHTAGGNVLALFSPLGLQRAGNHGNHCLHFQHFSDLVEDILCGHNKIDR